MRKNARGMIVTGETDVCTSAAH